MSIAVEMAAVVPESTPGTPASSDADNGASNSEGAGFPPSPVPIGRVVPTELKASIAVWDCGRWVGMGGLDSVQLHIRYRRYMLFRLPAAVTYSTATARKRTIKQSSHTYLQVDERLPRRGDEALDGCLEADTTNSANDVHECLVNLRVVAAVVWITQAFSRESS